MLSLINQFIQSLKSLFSISFQLFIDFLFTPSDEELKIRKLSPENFIKTAIIAEKTEFPFIKAIFSYKNPLVRELILQIKYRKNKKAIKIAGCTLYNELIKSILYENDNNINIENNYKYNQILLIPIPISPKRRKERGYNQTELIVDEIIKLDNGIAKLNGKGDENKKFLKDYDLLIRNKDIDEQKFKNRNERIHNIERIFKITNVNKYNKNKYGFETKIIIIDDVTTTGSTLKEAYDELGKAGFNNVEALTIAH